MPEPKINEQFANSFTKILSRHGYGFQFSVLKKAQELLKAERSVWQFEESEFPVEVRGGTNTKIDFILSKQKRAAMPDNSHYFITAECKRANPALANWCFLRAPYTHRNAWMIDFGILECVERGENSEIRTYAKDAFHSEKQTYHIGIELRTNETGDAAGRNEQSIEAAASQVLRGLNGFVQIVASHNFYLENYLKPGSRIYFLPVIFTTANLYIADIDLSEADLRTGNLKVTEDNIRRVGWLYFQYAQSPGLKHNIENNTAEPAGFLSFSQSQYVRTIPVVSVDGIEDFLYWGSHLQINY